MLDAELTMTGSRGPVRGGPGSRGAAIVPLDVRHPLISPRDVVTGQAIGERRHAPIAVTKEVDRATPRLLSAWASNETLTDWRLEVFGADQFGRRFRAYSIELRRAFVVEVSMTTPESSTFPREVVAFAYDRITWTWHDGNLDATDDWMAPI